MELVRITFQITPKNSEELEFLRRIIVEIEERQMKIEK